MKLSKKYIVVPTMLVCIFLTAGTAVAQDSLRDVFSAKVFAEVRPLDDVKTDEVVIDDVIYPLASSVQYFDDEGQPADLSYFKKGDLVYFSLNEDHKLDGMWVEPED